VPGIIEGASTGSGLGLDFLRHIERTRVLAHVIDASGLSGRDATEDYETICRELAAFSPALAGRPRVIVASRRDLVREEGDPLPSIKAIAERDALEVFEISAASGLGLKKLTQRLAAMLQTPREEKP
jgi:GTP-binding protein